MTTGKFKPLTILIVRPDRIGDVILSTGLPRELKKHFPGCRIGMLVRDYTRDLFVNNPNVDFVLSKDDLLNEKGNFTFSGIKVLRKHDIDISLTLLPEEKLNYLLFFSGVPLRIGVGHKFYQFITNVKSVYRRKYIPLRHEADFCADTVRKLGINHPDITPELYLTNKQLKTAGKKHIEYSEGKPLIGIHISSGGSAPNWKPVKYYELIDRLRADGRFSVMVTDNLLPAGFPFEDEIPTPNVGVSLTNSLINFSISDLFISASTGPMHISGALGVPTLSLFCPLPACSPVLWGPLGNKAHNLLPDEGYCSNICSGDPKKCTFEGQGGISVNQVYDIIRNKNFPIT